MPAYQYQAVDSEGRRASGLMEAANEIDLEQRLKRTRLDLLTCSVSAGSTPASHIPITRRDLITFCFHMEQISRSGIPYFEGLDDLRDGMENSRFRQIISAMLEDLEGGKVLSQALAAHPQVFDGVFVNLVRAGEHTGHLDEVFANLGNNLKWQDELIAHTRKLMLYPAIVLTVILAVLAFLLLYLVPQLVSLIKNMGGELPLQTRLLISLSEILASWWPLLFILPIGSIIALNMGLRRSQHIRLWWDNLKLNLPLTGPILRKIILSRFATVFATTYKAGIPVLEGLRLTQQVAGNRVIADALIQAEQQISAGESLSKSFQQLGIFPPLVLRMLRIGESTGALDTALLNISDFYNRDVKESIDKALKILEPALTVFLGSILGLIMYAVLMPVYDMLTQFKF